MPDQIIKERLEGIAEHITVLQHRMEGIASPADFKTEAGQVIYDSILMRLQSIGENIKKKILSRDSVMSNYTLK